MLYVWQLFNILLQNFMQFGYFEICVLKLIKHLICRKLVGLDKLNWNVVCSVFSRGRRMIGISGSLIWSTTLMEMIFNPHGEFRWSPDPNPLSSPPRWCPWDLSDFLRSVQMLKRERERERERVGCGKQREATVPIHL